MKNWIILISAVILVGLSGTFYVLKTQKAAQVAADKTMYEEAVTSLRNDEYERDADLVRSAQLQEQATQNIEHILSNEENPERKQQAAATVFMGYYLANERTRSNYCFAKGVNISNFRDAFVELHKNDLAKAKAVLFNTETQINEFYKLVADFSEATIAQDMTDMANILKISPEEACLSLENNAKDFAGKMQFRSVQTQAYKALHNL
ncbi:MAG: hypothetical protein OXE99_00315 [Cellvibrionales bacterium]|nr:hypothetical protein [Cellvibrionales bacterium]